MRRMPHTWMRDLMEQVERSRGDLVIVVEACNA
jgi:hypothetical protein